MEYVTVGADEIAESGGLDDWRFVVSAIHAQFELSSYAAAGALVQAIALAADEAGHHPDVSLRYPGIVRVTLMTHAVGFVTTHDISMARTISSLANDIGATTHATGAQVLEIAIDTVDASVIKPFWLAVLGYADIPFNTIVDPMRIGPPVWFQRMDEPRTERNRFHLDISVPHDVAEQRVAAAIDAGGTLVTDEHARSWWVLADTDGNEACVSTWQDR
jgi:4a-hydroxytetrahydrobiopterin dehydratase